MPYNIIQRAYTDEMLFLESLVAEFTGVSAEFLRECEERGLIRGRKMTGGGWGYNFEDLFRVMRIRYLAIDLNLNLQAIEVIYHMRRQILNLQRQIQRLERNNRRRELELQAEIQMLRAALSRETEWDWDSN